MVRTHTNKHTTAASSFHYRENILYFLYFILNSDLEVKIGWECMLHSAIIVFIIYLYMYVHSCHFNKDISINQKYRDAASTHSTHTQYSILTGDVNAHLHMLPSRKILAQKCILHKLFQGLAALF